MLVDGVAFVSVLVISKGFGEGIKTFFNKNLHSSLCFLAFSPVKDEPLLLEFLIPKRLSKHHFFCRQFQARGSQLETGVQHGQTRSQTKSKGSTGTAWIPPYCIYLISDLAAIMGNNSCQRTGSPQYLTTHAKELAMKTSTMLPCALFGLMTVVFASATWADGPMIRPATDVVKPRPDIVRPNPEVIAKRCLRRIAGNTKKIVRANRHTAARCVVVVNKLQAAGRHRVAKRHARICMRRISRRSDASIKRNDKICQKCGKALLRLDAAELARRGTVKCRISNQEISDSDDRAIAIIRKAVTEIKLDSDRD